MDFSNEELSRVRVCMIGNSKLSQLAHSLIPEFETVAEITIIDTIFYDAVHAARERVERNKVDIFISAGANAYYLKDTLPIPVISLKVEGADQISAVIKACTISKKILMLTYERQDISLDFVKALDGVEVIRRTYTNAEEAREVFQKLNCSDFGVVIGSSYVCDLAEQKGIPYVLLYSKSSCRNLISKAIKLAGRYKRRKQSEAVSQFLLDQSPAAQIITNRSGLVVAFNNQAVKLMPSLNYDKRIDNYLDARFHQQPSIQIEGVLLGERLVSIAKEPFDLGSNRVGYLFSFYASPVRTLSQKGDIRRLVYTSERMAEAENLLRIYGATPGIVLLQGETGTGKELAAREIHDVSKNSSGPFVTVNCAAIPCELFESELFGYADGAFTGSRTGGKSGLLESANNGTFFLDEVNAMPLAQQAKLLRVLQEREVRPVGSKRSITLNIKFVAACNINLYEQVKLGLFREDLYHRLNVFVVTMPSLRERLSDLPTLINYFSQRLCAQYEIDIDYDEFRDALLPGFVSFAWPGNVRQLENMLERLLVSCSLYSNIASFKNALPRIAPEIYANTVDKAPPDGGHLKQIEHDEILRALEFFNGNRTQAAEHLGMSQTTLWRRLKALNK